MTRKSGLKAEHDSGGSHSNVALSERIVCVTITIMNEQEQNMTDLREFFKRDRYAAHTGVELLAVAPGRAKAQLELNENHLNGLGSIQGGAIFTLADLTFAAAANSHGTVAVAINVSISYLKAVSTGTLYAEAEEIALNPRLGTYTVSVKDDQGALIALFQGLAYRKTDTPIIRTEAGHPSA